MTGPGRVCNLQSPDLQFQSPEQRSTTPMAVKLNDKLAESKTIQVKWGEDTVDVCYKPNAVTPRLLEDVEEAGKLDNLDVIGTLLEPVLDWWDVLLEDGSRVPTDAATIKGLPMRWLMTVQRALEADQYPPEPETATGGSLVG